MPAPSESKSSMHPLKQALIEEYGGFADKRIKKLDSGSTFIVDDRSDRDVGADGKLYSYFCTIFVEVIAEDELYVRMFGNVPRDSLVAEWINKEKADYSDALQCQLGFSVRKGQQSKIIELSRAIQQIVAPGKRYSVSNYKYVCPRTASSLERLATFLDRVWP